MNTNAKKIVRKKIVFSEPLLSVLISPLEPSPAPSVAPLICTKTRKVIINIETRVK
ncbi:MAG TPA: hypothetical protein VII94_02940 [Candidatus Saccharimonadales bacterium]